MPAIGLSIGGSATRQQGIRPPAPVNEIALNVSFMEYDYGLVANTPTLSAAKMAHYAARGLKTIRLPFAWGRMQPTLAGPLDAFYLSQIKKCIDTVYAAGGRVLLDQHSYGYRSADGTVTGRAGQDAAVPISAFADLWARLSAVFAGYPGVWGYDLYNEPENYTDLFTVPKLFDAATLAVRRNDALAVIVRGGNNYSGAWDADTARPNGFTHNDPVNRTLFACHCYPDRDSSGSQFDYAVESSVPGQAPPGVPTGPHVFEQRIKTFYDQLLLNRCQPVDGILGVIGELGIPNGSPEWFTVGENGLNYCRTHGLLPMIWAAGPAWGAYPQSAEPQENGLQAKVTALLTTHTGAAEPTVIQFTGPAALQANTPSAPWSLLYRGNLVAPITVALSDNGAGGTFTPAFVTIPAGRNPAPVTFTYTPASAITVRIRPTATGYSFINNYVTVGVDAMPANDGTAALVASAAVDAVAKASIYPSLALSATHRLVNTYTGPIVRLQRSDGTEKDFYPTSAVDGRLNRTEIALWAGGSAAGLKLTVKYDQSGAGRHDVYSTYPVYTLDGGNGYPVERRSVGAHSTYNVPVDGLLGETIIADMSYTGGGWLFPRTSNTMNTIGVVDNKLTVYTNDPNKTGRTGDGPGTTLAIAAGLVADGYHCYAWRFKADTTNGLQSLRDGAVVTQATTTGGAITWDQPTVFEGFFRFYQDGGTQMKADVRNTIFYPGSLPDADLAAIRASLNAVYASPWPAVDAPTYVVDPIDTPLAAPAAFTPKGNYKGVNIAGGEQNRASTQPYGYDYYYGDTYEYDYWASKGFGTMRLPFDIVRVQPGNYKKLSATQVAYIKTLADKALANGQYLVLDMHNYGVVTDTTTGADVYPGMASTATDILIDCWKRIASVFKNYPNVIFGIMNEPKGAGGQTAIQWRDAAIAVYSAIRAAGNMQMILMQGGPVYDSADSWATTQTTIWDAWLATYPTNFAFEMHGYLDDDNSGTHSYVKSGRGSTMLVAATAWCRTRNVKAFLGEFGWSPNDTQSQGGVPSVEGKALVDYMKANSDVWFGWTYWNGGTRLYYSSYIFRSHPTYATNGTVTSADQPQVAILQAGI